MDKRSSMLSKMADKLLQSADRSEAFAKSKEKYERIKRLHEAMTERYKFYVSKSYSTEETSRDIESLKKLEKKLTLTEYETSTLEKLFYKYKI